MPWDRSGRRHPIGDGSRRLNLIVDSDERRGVGGLPNFWASSAYAEVPLALWPARDEDAFAGPFEVPATSPAPLVIGTTYDPATPYRGSVQMVEDLGNAT
ncbi:MAG TPA: alpha/beta hydrolase, partial [Geodermatophilus sp.]|nr:alpha/beta hydrolase [Geodermatophilus sp.]